MYPSFNMSCRISNENTSNNYLGVMETDFLNFHDEEHFGTALYQNDLLDDSQSSLLDIVGDDYTRHESGEYVDHSIIWEQDVERELNGDVAVIPMSGQINTFPKLSNSPPSKDFQKIFSDWQHLTAIEATTSEDLAVDLNSPTQPLVVDMFDCLTPATIIPSITIAPTPTVTSSPTKTTATSIISSFDFSKTAVPSSTNFEPDIKKIEPKLPVRKIGGKNLELLKQVVKEDIDLDTPFKTDLNSSDELDSVNDNFDITSYVNGDDDLLLQNENKKSSVVKAKPELPEKQNLNRKFTKRYEKTMQVEPEKEEIIEDKKKALHEDSEEDCIDVETVSEQIPVLQARDLTSLLEQFEASEAVNPKLPQNVFEEPQPCQPFPAKIPNEIKSTSSDSNKIKPIINETKQKVKQLNSELKQPQKQLKLELLQKMKASNAKKTVNVIPARPSKKSRSNRIQETNAPLNRPKVQKISQNDSFQFDHDYCSISPVKMSQNSRNSTNDNDTNIKKVNSSEVVIKTEENVNKIKKNIDDTAIRIGKQIKNAINNENAIKQKLIMNKTNESILKNQPTVKNSDGKLMISLLKTNNRINQALGNKNIGNTIINTVSRNEERIQNIIINDTVERNSKKRKLNLEEYKKLRGEILKTTSCENSRQNSPGNSGNNSPAQTGREEYQELIMKMASEILKTNAKQKQSVDTKLEEFVLPNVQKPLKTEVEEKPEIVVKSPPKILQNKYEMKTIVSIGINTDESMIKTQNVDQKIMFKLVKKEKILRNKFFDCKSSESEDNSPIKNPDNNKTALSEIITPILKNASSKIKSNSLITNITETLLQSSPKISSNAVKTEQELKSTVKMCPKMEMATQLEQSKVKIETLEHGEDKTVIILNKNEEKRPVRSIGIQTITVQEIVQEKEKIVRQYRARRDSSTSSSTSSSSLKSKNASIVKKNSNRRPSLRNSSSNSISSSMGSRWSRSRSHSPSRSRSRSRSSCRSDYSHSSYSSDSYRSKSRSISPHRRWQTDRSPRSRHRFNRSQQRSRSNSFRSNYRQSRSPYSRSRSRRKRERESVERERMREVEERRVIYVGKISNDTSKLDLRRRFQSFGPITNVSVHFRDHGDNYGFVTFAYKVDAYEAVERGNDDPNLPKYDISFGGRRAFCKTRYSDLDNIEAEALNPGPIYRQEEGSFDILLREVQAKLRKRKV